MTNLISNRWRIILARLPLPMLALSASYGVYSFALLFVPHWVAVVQAAAFELTYIGLAVQPLMREDARQRATAISVGAVLVSILYNTLAGLFHRNPAWLVDMWTWYEISLAVLHGAPLAWVAYLVADLLLHTDAAHAPAPTPVLSYAREAEPLPAPVAHDARDAYAVYAQLRAQGVKGRPAAAQAGIPESTARQRWERENP
jgi:hypothetical protein